MYQTFISRLLFPAPKPSYTIDCFPRELVWAPKGPGVNSDGTETLGPGSSDSAPCLLLTYESAKFLIIYFHSNAEDLGGCRWFCQFLREQFQVHVLAVEYPGYGVCPGPTSCESIMENAHAAIQFATRGLKFSLDRIKLFGRSIGTGPTLQLAAKLKVAGVVLVAPFTSIRALFREMIGPLALLMDEWFCNDENIKQLKSPVIIIHGKRDRLIPWAHSEELYKSCPARKLFINPQLMEHNTNLTTDMTYLVVPMFRFFTLPDYSFEELEVPAWAFDKRRSAVYVRPEAQVCSHTAGVSLNGGGTADPSRWLPLGDDADTQPELEDMEGRISKAAGDKSPRDHESTSVVVQPTVFHQFSATKSRYIFQERAGEAHPGGSEKCHPLSSGGRMTIQSEVAQTPILVGCAFQEPAGAESDVATQNDRDIAFQEEESEIEPHELDEYLARRAENSHGDVGVANSPEVHV